MPVKTITLGKRHAGQTIARVLGLLGVARADIDKYLKNRWVRLDGKLCQQSGLRVRAGQQLQIVVPREKSGAPNSGRSRSRLAKPAELPAVARAIRIVYVDEHLVVVDKPAGLTTVRHADEAESFGTRARRYLPPTLVDLLPRVDPSLAQGRIRAVHRLDKETSGLVVLARTAAAERDLGKQFRAHAAERSYLALVRGRAKDERVESHLVADRGDGRRGSGQDAGGQRAITHIRVLEPLGAFTLVECRLETGRTHQVRIHLGERGTPLCGERVYDRVLHGPPLPDDSGAKRPMLHAATLGTTHPATGKHAGWKSDLPGDMRRLLDELRLAATR